MLLVALATQAVSVTGLYEALVPVADRSEGTRRAAAQEGLGLVLIKLTGDAQAASATATRDVRRNAERFVQQFIYEQRTDVRAGGVVSASGLAVRFRFDQRLLDEALRGLGYPVWGRERPATIAWLALTPAGQAPRLVGVDDPSVAGEVLREQSELRGSPVVLPILDLDDQALVSPLDLKNGQLDGTFEASRRYGAESLLAASVTEVTPGFWEAQWYSGVGDSLNTWSSRSDDLQLLIDEGFNAAVDQLVAFYVRPLSEQPAQALRVVIEDVRSVDDYARVSRYLQGLDEVSGLSVAEVAPGQVIFGLEIQGGLAGFDQTVMLGDTLRRVPGRTGSYRLIPR